MRCDNCQRDHLVCDYLVYVRTGEQVKICGPSCLVEWAWKQKEAQEELSKSS